MTPIVEELAEEYKDTVVIGKYNIEEENDLAAQYRIMSIPTILFFKNGEQIRDLRLAGAQPKKISKSKSRSFLNFNICSGTL